MDDKNEGTRKHKEKNRETKNSEVDVPTKTKKRRRKRIREKVLFNLDGTRKPKDFSSEDENAFEGVEDTDIEDYNSSADQILKTALDITGRVKITEENTVMNKLVKQDSNDYIKQQKRIEFEKIHADLEKKLQTAELVNATPKVESSPIMVSSKEFNKLISVSPGPTTQMERPKYTATTTVPKLQSNHKIIKQIAASFCREFYKTRISQQMDFYRMESSEIELEIKSDYR